MEINRTFRDLKEDEDVDQLVTLQRMGVRGTLGWNQLLKSQRVLMVSEAGAGKTHECRARRDALWAAGEPAFYLDLSSLRELPVRELLSVEEEQRFDAWLASQSDVATFFLDSIDELELTLGSFERTLIRFAKSIAGHLGRVRIVITTRPIPVDQELIRRHLPIPATTEARPGPEAFADIMLNRAREEKKGKADDAPPWRNVALMPLSDEEIVEFARVQNVNDPQAFFEDIKARDALDFARRPQDLIELCADWNDNRRIRKHAEQVAHNIHVKLKPRTDRPEKVALSEAKALEGASKLALSALLMRQLTIRHNAAADKTRPNEAALDPARLLSGWSQPERETLLERALFGFHTYGRVRFHHRSVIEFLAAERLLALLEQGIAIRAVKRLLFAQTIQGDMVPRPSMRPVAAWVARQRPEIYEDLRNTEPSVLLDYGDPASLQPQQRAEALRAYVARYGAGGWRGRRVPALQVHRFTSIELEPVVRELWEAGVENPEVRSLLLDMIALAKMSSCADHAYAAAIRTEGEYGERIDAVEALQALDDPRLAEIVEGIEKDRKVWSNKLARALVVRLFPRHLSVGALCRILANVQEKSGGVGEINWYLPQLVTAADLSPEAVTSLREGLTDLVADGARWDKQPYRVVTPRKDLVPALTAICLREWKAGPPITALLDSSAKALRLSSRQSGSDEWADKLRAEFATASPTIRETAFWTEDAFMQAVHPRTGSWDRVAELALHGTVRLNAEDDLTWVKAALGDKSRSPEHREMMLQAAYWLIAGRGWRARVRQLHSRVADQPDLIALIDRKLERPKPDAERKKLDARLRQSRQRSARRDARAHASWVKFWREVCENPDELFGPKRAENTAWNLWRTMERSGADSRASGWSRRFIEQHFDASVADRMRATLMRWWRSDTPTLESERPEDEKGRFLIRWQLGVAAIAAEAEDAAWAGKLSEDEAKLAARYAPLDFGGFPFWLTGLAEAHPNAVDAILGKELSFQLDQPIGVSGHSMFLQNIDHSTPEVARLFLPRIQAWLTQDLGQAGHNEDAQAAANRLSQAVNVLLKYGGHETEAQVCALANAQLSAELPQPLLVMWLPILLRFDPTAGVQRFEEILAPLSIEPKGEAVGWFASLFGDRHRINVNVDTRRPGFTPPLLLRLLRLAYTHVRIEDDPCHEGSYTPDVRDDAQDGRGAILSALIDSNGPEAWAAKMEMANDPLASHFRDRLIALARERAAEEVDGEVFDYEQMAALGRVEEPSPSTRDGIFAVMRDRLDDLIDTLLLDTSPREGWALIGDEKILRRGIAHELRNQRRGAYTVDQEGATADEKETDIRLRSSSGQEAVIELKIGEKNRSAADLRATLRDQIVTKYMASDVCRAGSLLISVASERRWQHPDSNAQLDLRGLLVFLNEEAGKLEAEFGGSIRLIARGLDLRPRLPTEAVARKKR